MNGAAPIGLVGGMSWQSSALYYRRLNELGEDRWEPHRNPTSVLATLCFDDLLAAANDGEWETVDRLIVDAACRLKDAGAALVMLTAFTAHRAADAVTQATGLPLVHAGDALANKLAHDQIKRVGLLGTAATLNQGLIAERIAALGIAVVEPDPEPAQAVDQLILSELTRGRVTDEGIGTFERAAKNTLAKGADAIALACTELPLLAGHHRLSVPVIDGVDAHVEAALEQAEAQHKKP
ncbi:MAG: amino acid racemase [Pseudomonadota bacterium]